MTTFQALIDAFLAALTHLLPISEALPESLNQTFHWPVASPELRLLVVLVGALCFLFFFRFDWLGMISAFIKTLARPLSLKPQNRNLDQHTFLFLMLITIPELILKKICGPMILENETLMNPLVIAAFLCLLAFGFQFSHRWNKRIHGLNHLKLVDGLSISFLALFSVHPAFPLIGMLWIGFALNNYHTEAIFKYSMLALGINLVVEAASLLGSVGLKPAFDQVGHLNAVAVIVVALTVFWLGLENLEKNLNEGTYKNFKWISLISAFYFIVIYFLRS